MSRLSRLARQYGIIPPKPGSVEDLKARFGTPEEIAARGRAACDPAIVANAPPLPDEKYVTVEIGDTVSWKRQKQFHLGKVIGIVDELVTCLPFNAGVPKSRFKYITVPDKHGKQIESFIGSKRAVIEVQQANGKPIRYVVPLLRSLQWRFKVQVIRGGGVDIADCADTTGGTDGKL